MLMGGTIVKEGTTLQNLESKMYVYADDTAIHTQVSSLVKVLHKLETMRTTLLNDTEGTGLDRSCVPLLTKRSKEHFSSATVLRRASRAESCLSASDTEELHTQSTGMHSVNKSTFWCLWI